MLKKTLIFLLLALFLAAVLSGCFVQTRQNPRLQMQEEFSYSNLLDEKSRQEVFSRLAGAGVSENYLDPFEQLVLAYNERMTTFENSDLEYMKSKEEFFLYQNGFVAHASSFVDYGDYYNYMKKWYGSGENEDILCRTLAFLLLQDMIKVQSPIEESEWACKDDNEYLYSDKEAMDKNGMLTFDEKQKGKYFTLFHPVKESGVISVEKMVACLQKSWKEHGVEFLKQQGSLLTIWAQHEGVIHNLHTAVLVTDAQGLLLVEKTNPLFPYQATRFATRGQVKNYMLETMKHSFSQDELPVPTLFVMENDKQL